MSSVAKFNKAPLNEVVCGVGFDAPDFSSVHFGLYWQSIQERFPTAPLDRSPIGTIEIMASIPSLRRVWFESTDRKQLIQLQSNRFHYNWRRLSGQNEYPHFDTLYPSFEKEWNTFQEWWLDLDKLPLQPKHYELTYLNQIDSEEGWMSPADTSKIFTFLGNTWSGFLPPPMSHDCNFVFPLPDDCGSLTIRLNQVKRIEDNSPMLLLELTARSPDCNQSIHNWFSEAHVFIVKAFIDLLSDTVKDSWGVTWLI